MLINHDSNSTVQHHNVNRYIKYTLSSEIEMLYTLLNDLNKDLLEGNSLKVSNVKAQEIIRGINYKVLLLDLCMSKLDKLDSSYKIDLGNLHRYLFHLESVIINGETISQEDIIKLQEIRKLNQRYTRIADLSFYNDKLEKMLIPQDVLSYFNELKNIINREKNN